MVKSVTPAGRASRRPSGWTRRIAVVVVVAIPLTWWVAHRVPRARQLIVEALGRGLGSEAAGRLDFGETLAATASDER